MNFIANLFIWGLIMLYVASCATKPPNDLDKTSSNYIEKKISTEQKILKSELQDIDYRLRNDLFSTNSPEQEKAELVKQQKEKKDKLDKITWEEELKKREKE